MKIGILVYSHTGNTLYVAQKMKEALSEKHYVNIERINSINDQETDVKRIVLKNIPDLFIYDTLIFASPVNGFTLAPVMKAYLQQIEKLSSKRVFAFVTMFFPFDWMGGNQAIKVINEFVERNALKLQNSTIIHWKKRNREKQIEDMITNFSNSL